MNRPRAFIICFLITSLTSCMGEVSFFADYDGYNSNYSHSVKLVSSPFKNAKTNNYKTIYSSPIEVSVPPTIRELPSNYSFDNELYSNKILYHGEYHGYDVFSWEDDNTFGHSMHGFQIDGFSFSSNNFIILVCFKHSDNFTSFYDIDSTGTYLSKNAIPLTYLFTEGVFSLNDIKDIYLERAYWLGDYTSLNGHYVFQVNTVNQYRIHQGSYPFDIHLEEYSYSLSDNFYNAIKMDKLIKSPQNAIYFGNYNGWELFMPTNGDGVNYNVEFNNTFFIKNDYLSNIYGYYNGKVENVSDLYQKGIIGDNFLQRVTNQCLSYCIDSYLIDNSFDDSGLNDYITKLEEDLYEEFIGYNQESIKYYLLKNNI